MKTLAQNSANFFNRLQSIEYFVAVFLENGWPHVGLGSCGTISWLDALVLFILVLTYVSSFLEWLLGFCVVLGCDWVTLTFDLAFRSAIR